MPYRAIDLRKVRTYPLSERKNLVKLTDLIQPGNEPPQFNSPELDLLAEKIVAARQADLPVIWMMGAHVIKSGLGPLIIDLMQRGVITHVAGNGAVGIHDFELAFIGETSEDVATSIEDGTFGMAEETGALTHQALREGRLAGLGYGESLGRFIGEMDFPHKEFSVLYHAWKLHIPLTLHITIGTDIIHQHPDCNFGILGAASGQDFRIFCHSVSKLDGGVFLNFGTAVTGPEVFLKAVSITRNLGYRVQGFTTANFDLVPLDGDYHRPLSHSHPDYYYRPRKNVINRPTSLNGQGYHIQGDHRETIPNLHRKIIENNVTVQEIDNITINNESSSINNAYFRVDIRSQPAGEALREMVKRNPGLESAVPALVKAYLLIAESFERGGRLFLYGNGGSMADALHISGELMKSYRLKRLLPQRIRDKLNSGGAEFGSELEAGLPAIVLGLNPALRSAIINDFQMPHLDIAQELQTLAHPGDVFLGISTSGTAKNVRFASQTAKALGLNTILLTGAQASELADLVDVAVHAPGTRTDLVQEAHISLYHCLCDMLERDFFGEEAPDGIQDT